MILVLHEQVKCGGMPLLAGCNAAQAPMRRKSEEVSGQRTLGDSQGRTVPLGVQSEYA